MRIRLLSVVADLASRRQYHWKYVSTGAYRDRLSDRLKYLDEEIPFLAESTDKPQSRFLSDVANSGGQRASHFEEELFHLLKNENDQVEVSTFLDGLKDIGLRETDPRLERCLSQMEHYRKKFSEASLPHTKLTQEQFTDCVHHNLAIIKSAFTGDLVIPEFTKFTGHLNEIYWECRNNHSGKVATYIPQLSRYSPNYWGFSMCSVDGQRHSLGEVNIPFCLQSASKPLAYGLALDELGCESFHEYVGQEPSGITFNAIALDPHGKPHNPMINAGAIVTASLVKTNLRIADRFDHVSRQIQRMAGEEFVSFNNAVFLSERETADRNFALGYYLKENNCFPYGVNLTETMDFYFQMCSIEINCESGAVLAATLANGGICPLTGEQIFSADAIRNVLCLMHSCGMYDYSGQFAFSVGLPAKSGVSGCILLVIPNVMGLCLWSPPLDQCGNSVRGIQFSKSLVQRFNFHRAVGFLFQSLVQRFNFHQFDNINATRSKDDPRKSSMDRQESEVTSLLFGACQGDMGALKRMALAGCDMDKADYDGRTPLHLAASEGHLTCVKFLLEQCKVPLHPKDRWGRTPREDAIMQDHKDVADYLQHYETYHVNYSH